VYEIAAQRSIGFGAFVAFVVMSWGGCGVRFNVAFTVNFIIVFVLFFLAGFGRSFLGCFNG